MDLNSLPVEVTQFNPINSQNLIQNINTNQLQIDLNNAIEDIDFALENESFQIIAEQHSEQQNLDSEFLSAQDVHLSIKDHEFPIADESSEEVEEVDESIEEVQNVVQENANNLAELTNASEDYSHSNSTDLEYSGFVVGVTTKTLEEIHEIYKKHATIIGFSVRKHTNRMRTGTRQIIEKYYVCSAEGKRNKGAKKVQTVEENLKNRKPRTVPVTRTDCKACIRVKLNDQGLFEVVQHVIKHNHELTRRQWNYLHRSERQITQEKAEAIQNMQNSGMTSMDSYRLMCEEAGGEEYLGHNVKDHLNYCTRLKMKSIEGGDAQRVIDMLYQDVVDDPEFFFRVRLNNEGKVCCIFWRDSMMKDDYDIYGDVVVFDTTYRTNRYNLICAPIVGINNHWQNAMFACAFIGNEKTESFVWLLQTFKKSMGGKCPKTIFTDQDQAMCNAIGQVFPDTRHRLCIWHLHQNAISRFGELKRDRTFNDTFNKCLKECVTKKEFDDSWSAMMHDYGLEDHTWFKRIYDLREKWCPAYSRDFFSAGILSSQRSESTNHAISFNANKATSLTEFYRIFKRTVRRWRTNEKNEEFRCSKSTASSSLPMSGLLKHAAEVYTLSLFTDFEAEYYTAIATEVTPIFLNATNALYEVKREGEPHTAHQVMHSKVGNTITCTCKNFEAAGWLCYHCIRVLHLHSVLRIPHQYILKRWTKYAKKEIWDRIEDKDPESHNYSPWRHTMGKKYYNLVLKGQGNEDARKHLEETYKNVMQEIDKMLSSVTLSDTQSTSTTSEASETTVSAPYVMDPDRVVTKGRSKRQKRGIEKSKKAKSNKEDKATSNAEFGAKTPNLHLF